MNKVIDSFDGRHRFLSNFYPCLIEYEGITYPSVEHAYQASKTLDHDLRVKISNFFTPNQAKQRGKTIKLRKDWDKVKLKIMEELLRKKFLAETILKLKLYFTKNYELIEGNWWGDRFWGVCMGEGENHLGKLLMKIREEIIKEVEEELKNIPL